MWVCKGVENPEIYRQRQDADDTEFVAYGADEQTVAAGNQWSHKEP